MNTSLLFNNPTAPSLIKGDNIPKYPELLSNSTNFRIKKIMDDKKLLQDEIKFRNSMAKKYARYSSLVDVVEYFLISADIVVGTLAATIPGVGSVISSATFSGVGLISGVAKVFQSTLNQKKLKHCKKSIIANTTLDNFDRKISKAVNDGQITHEEFEDIQNVINDWEKSLSLPSKQHITATSSKQPNLETYELLKQQAKDQIQMQKDLLQQFKQLNIK